MVRKIRSRPRRPRCITTAAQPRPLADQHECAGHRGERRTLTTSFARLYRPRRACGSIARASWSTNMIPPIGSIATTAIPAWRAARPACRCRRVPTGIKPGTHYVVVEALFSYPLPNWGTLNLGRPLVEPESGAVLYLRAGGWRHGPRVRSRSDHQDRNLADLPTASNAILDRCATRSTGRSLPPAAGHQNLSGTFVQIANVDPLDAGDPDHDRAVQFSPL